MSRGNFDVHARQGAYRVQKDGKRKDTPYRSFSAAEAAALRLSAAYPEQTFIITREVARVHNRNGS
jgi:hypothetical protein